MRPVSFAILTASLCIDPAFGAAASVPTCPPNALSKSAWQVAVYDSDWEPDTIASAFAVSPTLLATNAHVVDAVVRMLREDGRAFVVQHETGERREIESAWRHPGYTSDDRPGPDVGLLEVDKPLDDVLPLATREMLQSLAVGDEVQMYGFPGDVAVAIDAADESWGLDFPRVTVGFGKITALRRFNSTLPATRESTFLIQHDIRSVGGTSGSPILNPTGHVIGINAMGSNHGDSQGFAVRTDVLHPLIEMVRSGVLPPSDRSDDSPDSTSRDELIAEIVALMKDGDGWIVTWPIAIVGAVSLIGLVVLQRARYGHRRHRDLIAHLDEFVTGVNRRFNSIASEPSCGPSGRTP